MKADIGLIGLAVMGQNLVLNMNDNGYKVAVHNRSSATTDGSWGPEDSRRLFEKENQSWRSSLTPGACKYEG